MINYDSRPVHWLVGKWTPKTDKDGLVVKDKTTKEKDTVQKRK